jgi:hypothetical protein
MVLRSIACPAWPKFAAPPQEVQKATAGEFPVTAVAEIQAAGLRSNSSRTRPALDG